MLETLRHHHPDVLCRHPMCGRTDRLFPEMAELPVDIYEIDFPANLKLARDLLGQTRVLAGNVSTIIDLLEGTPERVYEAYRRCHEICGCHFIVGTGCEISPITPPENLRAMMAYARDPKLDDCGKR